MNYTYIGTCKHGKVVLVCHDDPKYQKDTAKFVADGIKRGYPMTRILSSEVKNCDMGRCEECRKEREK